MKPQRTEQEINAHLAFAKRYRDQLNNEIVQLEAKLKALQPEPIKITQHIELDAPMKSAVEWFCEINYDDWSKRQWEDFIRAIQTDAIASKLPEVDLRGLAEEIAREIICQFPLRGMKSWAASIHAALLKAIGGV